MHLLPVPPVLPRAAVYAHDLLVAKHEPLHAVDHRLQDIVKVGLHRRIVQVTHGLWRIVARKKTPQGDE